MESRDDVDDDFQESSATAKKSKPAKKATRRLQMQVVNSDSGYDEGEEDALNGNGKRPKNTVSNIHSDELDYLEYCSKEGQGALELLLTKIPIRTERQALKIASIAHKKGFTNAEEEICKVQAKKSWDDGRYGNALEWAIRSKDTLYVTSIADFLFNVKNLRCEVNAKTIEFRLILFYKVKVAEWYNRNLQLMR